MAFANSMDLEETAHNEPSYLDLCCLTFSLLTLHINFFATDSLLRKGADDKCCLKFGTETGLDALGRLSTIFL